MKAIIIGGGIAGLASAMALTRRNWQVEVLERAPSPAAVHLRDTALRLLPSSSFVRSLAPVLDWAA